MFKKLFLLALLFGFSFGDDITEILKKCNSQDPQSCIQAGDYFSKQDPLEFYKKACYLKNDDGCLMVAKAYKIDCDKNKDPQSCIQAGDYFSKQDPLEFYKKACYLKNDDGCLMVAKAYKIDCDKNKNAMACLNSADYLSRLNNPDNETIMELYLEACNNLKDGQGCLLAGSMYEKSDIKKAKFYYKKGCKLGFELSCVKSEQF